jgi:hypothetical protein
MLIVLELLDFSLSCNKDGQDGDKGAIHCLPFLNSLPPGERHLLTMKLFQFACNALMKKNTDT